MRKYVFVFENDDSIMTVEGINTQPSYFIEADNLDSAIGKLINLRDSNDDQNDYKEDILEGNITVLCPVAMPLHNRQKR